MEEIIKQISKNPTLALIALGIMAGVGRFSFNRLIKQFETIATELKDLIHSVNNLSNKMALSNEGHESAFGSIGENKAEIKQMRDRLHHLGGEVASTIQLHEERLSTITRDLRRIEANGCPSITKPVKDEF